MHIYAMSDIHGDQAAFEDALTAVDLSSDNKLILLGDYIDGRHEHPEFLSYIHKFQTSHEPGKVVVLMGNHEASYLEEIGYGNEFDFAEQSLDELGFVDVIDEEPPFWGDSMLPSPLNRATLRWVCQLKPFFETDCQIFVHAGVDENAGDLWREGTEQYYFYSKYPATFGTFEKDIIAGHVGTYTMCGESRVFWDGESHYFIDGSTETTGRVPVLKYDTATGAYTTFVKAKPGDPQAGWIEQPVRAGS